MQPSGVASHVNAWRARPAVGRAHGWTEPGPRLQSTHCGSFGTVIEPSTSSIRFGRGHRFGLRLKAAYAWQPSSRSQVRPAAYKSPNQDALRNGRHSDPAELARLPSDGGLQHLPVAEIRIQVHSYTPPLPAIINLQAPPQAQASISKRRPADYGVND